MPENESPSPMMLFLIFYLADQLKDAYCRGGPQAQYYNVIDFQKNRATSIFGQGRDDPIWRSLASKLIKIGNDGADYMRFQFREGPYPKELSDICSDSALEAYRQELQSKDPIQRAEEAVIRELGLVESAMARGEELERILYVEQVRLNPLLRYCLAVRGGFDEFVRAPASEAKSFLLKYPEYRAPLGALFVEPFQSAGSIQQAG